MISFSIHSHSLVLLNFKIYGVLKKLIIEDIYFLTSSCSILLSVPKQWSQVWSFLFWKVPPHCFPAYATLNFILLISLWFPYSDSCITESLHCKWEVSISCQKNLVVNIQSSQQQCQMYPWFPPQLCILKASDRIN